MSKARQLADLGNAYDDGALSNRNIVTNGAMTVAQRGTSFTVNANQYTLDRWKIYQGSGASLTVSQETFSYNDAMVSEGFLKYLKIAVSTGTGTAGTDARMFRQKVEHPHRVAGKTLTYSFWIKSNAAANGSAYYVDMFLNSGSSQDTYFDDGSLSGTVSTEWERKTHTFFLPDAKSAFTDSGYLEIMVNLTNDTSGDEYYITGVQLEVGDTATPFEHRSYGQELALCQRYYEKFAEGRCDYAQVYGTAGQVVQSGRFGIEKRATPTITATGNPTTSGSTFSNGYTLGSIVGTSSSSSKSYSIIWASSDSGRSPGDVTTLSFNSTNYLEFDAEL